MSSGVIPANINNFRLTEGVKSTRESAVFRSDPRYCGAGNTLAVLSRRNDAEAGGRAHAYRSAKSSRGGLGKSACEGERFCPISAGGGAGNTLAVLSRRRSLKGGENVCPRVCFCQSRPEDKKKRRITGYKEGGENEDASLRIAPYFYINIYFV